MATTSTQRPQACGRGVGEEGMEAMPDDELLDRFLGPDESTAGAAFATLVARHGPMVMGVCRHTLGRLHDAEDAFQATFLVLARKASTIKERRCLSRWLYEVAYHVAIRGRARAAALREKERQGVEMSATAPEDAPDLAWAELRPVLHEEIHKLPENYRAAVVLCYLEGRTNEEAARLLEWPVGTVKGRLTRAREMLRSRLTRRGLGLSAMFLMAVLSRREVLAEVVPSGLVEETARMALTARRLGPATVPSPIAELAEDAPASAPPWLVAGGKALLLALAVFFAGTLFLKIYVATTSRVDASALLRPPLLPIVGPASTAPVKPCH